MVRTLFLTLVLAVHPVHVTLMSLDYVEEQNRLNSFLKVYFDDFLTDSGYDKNNMQALKFQGVDTFTQDFISKYCNEKVNIIVNNVQLSSVISGYNLEGNELTINLYFGNVDKIANLTVKSLIMTELHSDQANMVIVRINDFEKGIKLTSEIKEQTFTFN